MKQLIDLCLNPFLFIGSLGTVLLLIKTIIEKRLSTAFYILLIEIVLFCLIYIFAAFNTLKKRE